MMVLWPLHRPGMRQFVISTSIANPDLRGGFYVADWCGSS